jgi:hypothetical protein
MKGFIFLLFLSAPAFAQSSRTVKFADQAMSADYLPKKSGWVTAFPYEVSNGETGEYYRFESSDAGVKAIDRAFHETDSDSNLPWNRGQTLATRFASAVNNTGGDEGLVNWLIDSENGWGKRISASKDKVAGFEGYCHIWSAWSLDPRVTQPLRAIENGMICGGQAFEVGELKELVTALRDDPKSKWSFQPLSHFRGNANESENAAYSRMGLIAASGDLSPKDLIAKAQDALKNGKSMILEMEPGDQSWNHPVLKLRDDETAAPAQSKIWETVSSADFEASGTQQAWSNPNYQFLANLKDMETSLAVGLPQGKGMGTDGMSKGADRWICEMRQRLAANADCTDLTKAMLPSIQVAEFQKLKLAAMKANVIQPVSGVKVTQHELTIDYAVEVPFASSQNDSVKTRVISYVSVSGRKNSKTGTAKDDISYWNTPVQGLREICAHNPPSLGKRTTTVLTPEISAKTLVQQCLDFKNGTSPEIFYFTGAPPPQDVKFVEKSPDPKCGSAGLSEQQRGYCKLLEFLGTCDQSIFNDVAQFKNDFRELLKLNTVSLQKKRELLELYSRSKRGIDLKTTLFSIDGLVDQTATLNAIKHSARAPDAKAIEIQKNALWRDLVLKNILGTDELKKSWLKSMSDRDRLTEWKKNEALIRSQLSNEEKAALDNQSILKANQDLNLLRFNGSPQLKGVLTELVIQSSK